MKQVLWVAALVTTALAGCADEGPADSGPGATSGEDQPFLAVLSTVATDRSGSEPSLGVAPDGTLFTVLGSFVYRSTDGGHTWTDLGNPFPNIPNNDPDLAVDVDGTVWESRLVGTLCNAVSVSQDQGETWTNNLACDVPVGDRQYVIPTQGGEAYLYWHQLPTFHQTVMKTTDHGGLWLPQGTSEGADHHTFVNAGSGWGGGGFWNAAKGSTFLTYTWNEGGLLAGSQAPGFSVTRDGTVWERGAGPIFDGAGLGLSLVTGAADDAGNVYLSWGESMGEDGVHVYVSGSQDDGRTWSPKVRIDVGTPGSRVFPVVVAGEDGRVAVAYYESPDAAHPDVAERWNVTLAWTQDFWGGGGWQHGALSDAIVKGPPICISGTTCQGNREFGDYFDAVRLPDGRVGVTYNSLTDGVRHNWYAATMAPLLGASS